MSKEARPGRGGKREGAGRPRSLSMMQELAIGLACEAEKLRFTDLATREKLYEKDRPATLRANLDSFKDPTSEERRKIKLAGENRLIPRAAHVVAERAKIVERVFGAIGTPQAKPRLYEIPETRPKGHRAEILQAGIKFAKDEYGVTITATKARHCWDYAKDIEKRLATEDEAT